MTRRPAIRTLGAVAGLLAVVLLAVACTNSSSGPDPEDLQTPAFSFHVKKATSVITAFGKEQQSDPKAAKPAGEEAAKVLSSFYTAAFLDPANWQTATYGEDVFGAFDAKIRPDAEAQSDVLTAGHIAGEGTTGIKPTHRSGFKVRVLLDDKGEPSLVVAIVSFGAKVTGGGEPIVVESKGRYFLAPGDGGWKIVAFEVTRNDAAGGKTSSASASTDETGGTP